MRSAWCIHAEPDDAPEPSSTVTCEAPIEPTLVEDVTCGSFGEVVVGVIEAVDEICVWTSAAASPTCFSGASIAPGEDGCVRSSGGAYTANLLECPAPGDGVRVEVRTAGQLLDCVVTSDDPALNPCGCRRFERAPDTAPCPDFDSIGYLDVECFGGVSSWYVGLRDEGGGPELQIVTASETFDVPKDAVVERVWGCVVRPGCPTAAEIFTIIGRVAGEVIDCAEAGAGVDPAHACRDVPFTLVEIDAPPTCPNYY